MPVPNAAAVKRVAKAPSRISSGRRVTLSASLRVSSRVISMPSLAQSLLELRSIISFGPRSTSTVASLARSALETSSASLTLSMRLVSKATVVPSPTVSMASSSSLAPFTQLTLSGASVSSQAVVRASLTLTMRVGSTAPPAPSLPRRSLSLNSLLAERSSESSIVSSALPFSLSNPHLGAATSSQASRASAPRVPGRRDSTSPTPTSGTSRPKSESGME